VWFSVRFYFLVILCVSACSNTSLLCEAVQFLLKTLMSMHFESVTARLCFSLKRLWRPKGRLETCSTGYEIESDLTLLSKSLGLTLVQWVQHTFSTQRTSFLSIKVREPLSKIPVWNKMESAANTHLNYEVAEYYRQLPSLTLHFHERAMVTLRNMLLLIYFRRWWWRW
jgi:hypothetical protein